MTNPTRWILVLGAALCAPAMSLAQMADPVIPLRNWTVPPYSSGSANAGGITAMTDNTPGVAFVGMQPCRIIDTRNANGPYGGPILAAGSTRTFDLDNGPCSGIPPGVEAYSLNIGAIVPPGNGFLTIWPTGEPLPNVSALNYLAGEVIANAAIVPSGTSGSVDIFVSTQTNIYLDINGYFTDEFNPGAPGNQFVATSAAAGLATIFGTNSSTTAGSSGVSGLASATTGTVFGVFGKSSSTSTNAAGVKGVDTTGELSTVVAATRAGVRGDSASGVGVSGFSRTTAVTGSLLDGSTPGNVQAAGYLGYSVGPYGVYAVGDIGATGMKFFVEPHPTDASRVIRFVALEGPEAGTYFRGSSRTLGGSATIEVPESFQMVTDEEGLTVQLTAVGALIPLAVITKDLNQITVRSSRDVAFDYEVKGVRRGFSRFEAITRGHEFMPESAEARLPAHLSTQAQQRLIANGTFNEDGSVNLTTAERLGWTRLWMEKVRPGAPGTTRE